MKVRTEEQIGTLLAAGGILWAAYHLHALLLLSRPLLLPAGPLEVCAIGVLIWLHSKWRRSISG